MQRDLSALSTLAEDYISFDAVYPEMVNENGVAVWREAWRRRQEFLSECAGAIHPAYFRGLQALELRPDRFPTLPEVNDVLANVGWRAAWVPGFIPAREFADLIRGRCFPLSAGVRPLEFVDHAPAPDALHDIWGHLPFLFDETYSEYLLLITGAMLKTAQGPLEVELYEARKELGGLQASHAPAAAIREAHRRLDELEAVERTAPQLSTRLSRLFLWSIEFGLLGAPGDFVIVGAAILSSPLEAYGVLRHPPPTHDFTIDATDHEILFTEPQQRLFVAPGFETYRHVLDECLAKYGDAMPIDQARAAPTR
jgi:phenylalanine-4-hydroxylase